MGHGESRREVHPASDDLDVARRFARGGPGQRGVEFTERGDFRREPAPAAQGGGQSVIVPRGEVVVTCVARPFGAPSIGFPAILLEPSTAAVSDAPLSP
jgi:hypothetical protein